MRKRQPKQDPSYMLFIFGDFDEQENLATNLSSQLLTVVSSPFLKFTYGEYGVVFHFRSKEVFSDLKEYIDMGMSEITEQYFLMEVTKNVDIKMPRKLKKDFLNIDQAAEYLGLSKPSLYKLTSERKIVSYKPTRTLYFKEEDLKNYILNAKRDVLVHNN